MSPSAYDWAVRFAKELGTAPPDHGEFNALLGLSSVAAHSSERKAAPVACWLAARAGVSPSEAIAVARRIGGEPEKPSAAQSPDEQQSHDEPARKPGSS